jgi:hypothetical protein
MSFFFHFFNEITGNPRSIAMNRVDLSIVFDFMFHVEEDDEDKNRRRLKQRRKCANNLKKDKYKDKLSFTIYWLLGFHIHL